MKHELWLDLDGTLLGSRGSRLKRNFLIHSTSYFRKNLGLSFLKSFKAIHLMRRAIETPNSQLLNEERAALAIEKEFGIGSDQALLHVREMANQTFSKLETSFLVIPGANEFVLWAREHFDLVLATNPVWPETVVKLRLSWAGISPANFQLITHAGSMHASKPNVGYYEELLKIRNSPEKPAKKILMIGDSIKKDSPSMQIGVPFFWLKDSQTLKQEKDLMWSGDFKALKHFLTKDWIS